MTKYEIGLTIGRALLAEPETRDALFGAYVDRPAHDTATATLADAGLWSETIAEGVVDAIETAALSLSPGVAEAIRESAAAVA
jgi:hypothetical protein